MSVIEWKEIDDGRDGDDTLKSDGTMISRYTRVFRVRTDNSYDDASVIMAYPSCPRVGVQYLYDTRAYCRSVRPRQEMAKRIWIVTAGYSSEQELKENPLDEPAEIEWTTEQFQKPAEKDRNGKAIVTSAGDPYDPAAQIDDSRICIVIKKNLAVVPVWILTYADARNNASFEVDGVTIPEGRAKMQAVRVSKQQERNNIPYRVVTLTMHLAKPRTGKTAGKEWYLWLLDQGFRELDPDDDTKRRNIRNDSDDELPTGPVPLDGNGHVLENPTIDNAVYNDYDVYDPKDFSVLPLS